MKRSLVWLLPLILTACHQPPPPRADQWADYRKGYQFFNTNKDSAFFYFNKAATSSTDKKVISLSYRIMATIQSDAGDNYGAQESLTQSLNGLDEQNQTEHNDLASDDDELGLTFLNLENPDQAIIYFQSALEYINDAGSRSYILNHLGNAYADKKAFAKALTQYDEALQLAGNNTVDRARILTNIALARWRQDDHYNAAPVLLAALNTRVRDSDTWGENASYEHLADYYAYKQPDSAIYYARRMLALSSTLRSADKQLAALQQLIPLSNLEQAKKYFQRFQQLNDSVQKARNMAKNQFALIRYNVEKAKTENIQLQKKNAEKRYQLIGLLAFTVLFIAFGIWWYKKRQQQLRLQAETDIHENKLSLSQKIHDKVANGIYRVMNEVEHNPELQKTALLDQLEDIYEISRNIAHDRAEAAADFTERLSTMLNAFKKKSLKLGVSGNKPELWQNTDENMKEQLLLVLQELMVNMSKHSAASQALVGFSIEKQILFINYQDNGIGLPSDKGNGMGIQNTVSRIEALKGSVTFGRGEAKGLRIDIQLPINHDAF